MDEAVQQIKKEKIKIDIFLREGEGKRSRKKGRVGKTDSVG
jgi:sRNA-binding regulator protein Hfq